MVKQRAHLQRFNDAIVLSGAAKAYMAPLISGWESDRRALLFSHGDCIDYFFSFEIISSTSS